MDIKVTKPKRKVKAVIGIDHRSIFIQGDNHSIYFIQSGNVSMIGVTHNEYGKSLEDIAKIDGRMPIYEGDEITIKF